MKLDFNSNNIRKNNVELLDCQIDLILKSLEFYSYTYHQILSEYNNQDFQSYKNEFLQAFNEDLKKVS